MTAITVVAAFEAAGSRIPRARIAGAGAPSATSAFRPAPAAYLGGIALRDGFAREYQERTGQSWFAHISHGRPRRRLTPRRGVAGQPVAVATERAER